ncbi:MAG: isoprenoid biosynthesis glyoxalase ElbB [Bernardetiaceae bacterium]|nr:isoprenoid biosynthesis glyoxalase ElbB [Bernardetiaceae bacterium]
MKIGVLLSGCGVYDGSEIHEAVLTLLALEQEGAEVVCIAPDIEQHHVINHVTGEPMQETRNVFVEAARIARGEITKLADIKESDLDGLVLPGGFGVAKNFTKWAFEGPQGSIDEGVANLIKEMVRHRKPVAALCMAPTTLAKALEGTKGDKIKLTVGNIEEKSPYEIDAISQGINATGAEAIMCGKEEIVVDDLHNIITTPCYMMENSVAGTYEGIRKAVAKLTELVALHAES